MTHETPLQVQAIAGTPAPHGISLARFTSDSGPLGKEFSLDAEGNLVKRVNAFLTSGVVENLTLDNLDAFAGILPTLNTGQALAYGVSKRGDGWPATIILSGRRQLS